MTSPRLRSTAAGVLSLAVATAIGTPATARVIDRVVAVVNDDVILESELERRVSIYLPELDRVEDPRPREQRIKALRREVLDRLIDEQLIQEEARRLKITVGDDKVDRAIDEIKRQNNGIDTEQLIEALKQQGYSFAAYREDLRRQIERIEVMNVAVRSRISVSDDEVKAYYQQNLRDLGGDARVHARHILIAVPDGAPAEMVEAKRRRASEILAQARGGKDFAELARETSEDAATRADGGDLGHFGRSGLPQEMADIVFAMRPGELRGPIRGQNGFHLFLLVDRQQGESKPLSEVQDKIREQLYQRELDKQMRSWLQELRKRTHIEVRP